MAVDIIMEFERLTGKRRHRSTWLGKLVLQVQVVGQYWSDGMYSPDVTFWRDAKTSDLPDQDSP